MSTKKTVSQIYAELISESDPNTRMANGPYRMLLPPLAHAVTGMLLPSASNLPGWESAARESGMKIVSAGGADKLPSSTSNDSLRPPPVVDFGASVKLEPVKQERGKRRRNAKKSGSRS